MAIDCNDILNKSNELIMRFESCYMLKASDLDEIVELIIAVNSCATGSNGVGIQSTINNGDGTFTITYTDNSTFTSVDLTGPQGIQGIQGIQGLLGLAGADGSTILNGSTIPNTFIGEDGDFYIKTDTYDFYGPKTSGQWNVLVNLKGNDGVDGIDGQGIISGGSTGQVLSKIDNTDFNTEWINLPSGGTGNMLKSTYDTNNNGLVDNSELINGLTVETSVPINALFTDTTYTDLEIKNKLENNLDTNTVTDFQLLDINTISSKLDSIVGSTNVTIDNTDPNNPIISINPLIGVQSVNGLTGEVILGTDEIPEESNLYYTEDRVSSNSTVVLNTAKIGITSQQTSDIINNNSKINDVIAGTSVSIDKTDPLNPIINLNTTGGGGGGISNVIEDTTPQLGGDLDLNGFDIPTKEDDLGNPSINGYVLSSLTDGTRSWIANGVGGSVDQSANYNWTGNHSFTKDILIGDGTNSETRIDFNDANANNSYIDVKNGEFSFNAWDGGVYKNIFNASTTHFRLDNSTIASIDAGTNKHVVTKEYTNANYATISVIQVEVVTPNIYTTILTDNGKTVNTTTSGNSIILDGTGLPIGFQQNFFNNSGGDINIQLAANNTAIQAISALPNSNPAYAILKEVTPNLVWQVIVGGTQESSLLNISSLVQNIYTITGTEHNEFLSFNNPTGVDITLDYNNNTPLGTVINFRQSGGGQLTFIEGANVSIVSSETLKTRKQHSVVSLIKISDAGTSSVWTLIGDLELIASDTTLPTLTSITIEDAVPSNVVMVFDEPVTGTNLGFTLVGTTSTTFNSLSGSGTTWTGTLATPASNGETITLNYNSITGDFQDLAGNALVDITNQSVTNNVTSFSYGIATIGANDEYLHIPFSPGANTWEIEIDVDAVASAGVFWANASSPSVNSGSIQLISTPTTAQIRYHDGTANNYGSAVPYSVGDKITTRHTGTAIEVLINGVVQDTNTTSTFSWLGTNLNIGGYSATLSHITTSIDLIKTKILAVEETFIPTNQSSGATIIGSNGTTMTLNSTVDVNAMYYQL